MAMGKNDKLKLGLAVGAFALAGLLVAYQFGAFDSLRAKPKDPNLSLSPDQKKEAARQKKKAEEQAEITPPSGS